MQDITRQLALLVVATTVASVVTLAALLAPQAHPLAQFAEAGAEPTMEQLAPLATTMWDDLAGGLALWVQLTSAVWLVTEGSYWLTLGRRSTASSS